jgi:hypothetical protein
MKVECGTKLQHIAAGHVAKETTDSVQFPSSRPSPGSLKGEIFDDPSRSWGSAPVRKARPKAPSDYQTKSMRFPDLGTLSMPHLVFLSTF